MAVQSSFRNMVLCLLVICLVSSALLAGGYALTKAPIDAAAAAKTNTAIASVVPEFDGEPVKGEIAAGGKNYTYYTVSKDGKVVGYAIMSSASGFGGPLNLMVGVTGDGIVYDTSVLSQNETPGLGAKCTEPSFSKQFRRFDPAEKTLKVKKDGGSIDAITASTITSRAYTAAVQTALDIYSAVAKGTNPDSVSGATSTSWSESADGGQSNE